MTACPMCRDDARVRCPLCGLILPHARIYPAPELAAAWRVGGLLAVAQLSPSIAQAVTREMHAAKPGLAALDNAGLVTNDDSLHFYCGILDTRMLTFHIAGYIGTVRYDIFEHVLHSTLSAQVSGRGGDWKIVYDDVPELEGPE